MHRYRVDIETQAGWQSVGSWPIDDHAWMRARSVADTYRLAGYRTRITRPEVRKASGQLIVRRIFD